METFSMSRKEVPRAGLLKALVLLRRTQADDVSETIARRIGNASPPTPFDNDDAPAYGCQPNDWSMRHWLRPRGPSPCSPCSPSTTRSRRWNMARGNLKVLDSDIHIIEPPDLWQRYIDPAFRDRAPYGLTEDAGDLRLAFDGKPWGRVGGTDADRSRRRQGHDYPHNQQRWTTLQERGWTSKSPLAAMDTDRIDVAAGYP